MIADMIIVAAVVAFGMLVTYERWMAERYLKEREALLNEIDRIQEVRNVEFFLSVAKLAELSMKEKGSPGYVVQLFEIVATYPLLTAESKARYAKVQERAAAVVSSIAASRGDLQ